MEHDITFSHLNCKRRTWYPIHGAYLYVALVFDHPRKEADTRTVRNATLGQTLRILVPRSNRGILTTVNDRGRRAETPSPGTMTVGARPQRLARNGSGRRHPDVPAGRHAGRERPCWPQPSRPAAWTERRTSAPCAAFTRIGLCFFRQRHIAAPRKRVPVDVMRVCYRAIETRYFTAFAALRILVQVACTVSLFGSSQPANQGVTQ